MNGELMLAEIGEQPAMFERVLRCCGSEVAGVARQVAMRAPRFVLLAGRGTSDHAALYAKYLVEIRLGLPAGLVSPSTTTLYDVHASMRDVLYIAVSQSGSSPDLIESLDRARASGATTLAVTNAPDSDLARQSEFSVYVHAGTERSVAATKSYTAQLLSLFVLVEAIAGRQGREASGLADLAAEILAQEARIKDICCRYRFAEQIVVASRGYNYPTARESALKLMETSYLVAHAFSGADLLHGPMAMIQKGFPVIAIIPPGHGGTALMPVMQRLRAQRADVLVVGSAEHSGAGTSWLHVVDQLPEVVSPLLLILPMQLFAWHLARARGIDPDVPAGLEKVTRTR